MRSQSRITTTAQEHLRSTTRVIGDGIATTNAKLHVSNQKPTCMHLKPAHFDGRFQVLPIGGGVPKQLDGFWLPELKGGNTA